MNLHPDPDSKLEQFIDRELKKLSELPAPPAVLRNVMARVRATSGLPWWQRRWLDWPIAARVAALGLLAGVVTGLAVMPFPIFTLERLATRAHEQLSWMTSIFGVCLTLMRSAMLVLTSLPSAAVWTIGAMIVIMYVAFLGFGTVLYRVTYTET